MTKYNGKTPTLPNEQMRYLGFTDHVAENWYWCRRVDSDTTLNFRINKETGLYTEDVLNEFSGQPEYYGHMVHKYRDIIKDTIDFHLKELNQAGLTLSVDHKLYGCA
jgi:hypothetical protein